MYSKRVVRGRVAVLAMSRSWVGVGLATTVRRRGVGVSELVLEALMAQQTAARAPHDTGRCRRLHAFHHLLQHTLALALAPVLVLAPRRGSAWHLGAGESVDLWICGSVDRISRAHQRSFHCNEIS